MTLAPRTRHSRSGPDSGPRDDARGGSRKGARGAGSREGARGAGSREGARRSQAANSRAAGAADAAPDRRDGGRLSPRALGAVVEQAVQGLGYELVDLEAGGKFQMIRVFIDRPGADPRDPLAGINVRDCEAVTRQLQHELAVHGLEYGRLEVSSPGLDRVLKKPADFERFVGFEAELRLRMPRGTRRRFTGVLRAVTERAVEMDVAGVIETFAFDEVDKARLVPRI